MDEIRTTPLRPGRPRTAAVAVGAAVAAASIAVLLPTTPAIAAYLPRETRMVSRDSSGGVNGTTSQATISGNGRFVAFITAAPVTTADTNAKKDVYVRDRWAATTELVSMTDDEKPLNADVEDVAISDDGRYVAFLTKASNLIANDDKGLADAFVRDRYEGRTIRVAPSTSNGLLSAGITDLAMSGNGRFVAFSSAANNIVVSDTNASSDVFVRDLNANVIERVSLSALDGQGSDDSDRPTLSDDGRYVAFASTALLASGFVGETNVYVRDRTAGTTEIIDVRNSDGTVGDHGGSAPYISGDGKKVAFASQATNLVTGDTNGQYDTFVRDRVADTTVRVSLTDGDAQMPLGGSPTGINKYGDRVLFFSRGPATTDDTGEDFDVYLRDIPGNTTRRITTGPSIADPVDAFTVTAVTDDNGQDVAFSHAQKLTGESFDQSYVNGNVWLGPFVTSGEATAQQYQDFLGRAPTASELSTPAAGFANESWSLPALQAKLLTDPAFAGKRAPISRLYWAFFLRRPDPSGFTYWLGKYQAGATLNTIAQSFAKSSEFTTKYGSLSNSDYVKQVYLNVFSRQPDASGLAYWTGKLDAKALTRGAVIVQFSESSEGKRRLAGPTNITLLSLAMLRRVPTASEWTTLYGPVQAGEAQPAWIARTLMTFNGYESRFD